MWRLVGVSLCLLSVSSQLLNPVSLSPADEEGLTPRTVNEIVTRETESVRLRCTVEKNENSSLQWSNPVQQTLFFDQKKALRDPRIVLNFYSRNELTILIHNVSVSDEGEYTCSVFTMPVRTATSTLTVWGIPERPEILGLKPQYTEGEMVSLSCSSSGNKPVTTLRWLKGNEQLIENGSQIDAGSEGRAYTVVSQVYFLVSRLDNEKQVNCLTEKPSERISSVNLNVIYPPSVTITPSSKVVKEDEIFTLRCIANSNPPAVRVLWTRFNGEFSDRAFVRGENLTFRSLNKSDEGLYRCEATNEVGTEHLNYTLSIHDSVTALSPASVNHAIVGCVVAILVFLSLCLFIAFIRYLIHHKGTYVTHEAKGCEDGGEANAAIINSESATEEKREYYI